jgi:Homeobox KN domain
MDRTPFCASGTHHQAPLEMGMDYYEPSRGSKRRRGNLPKPVTDLLRSWLTDHLTHPYPTEEEKQMLMVQTGLSISQVCWEPPLEREAGFANVVH